MIRFLKGTIVATFLLLALSVHAEQITDFSSVYTINADGTVAVTEVIEYDFGAEERRGIFRTLSKVHPQPAVSHFSTRFVEYDIREVTQDGLPAEFEVSDSKDELTVRIGNPEVYITGSHTYKIEYTLRGALSYGTEGAELYFDVTGNGWSVSIVNAVARVDAGEAVMLTEQAACYQGAFGSSNSCSSLQTLVNSTTFTAENLAPYEGLTIAQEVNESSVATLVVEKKNIMWVLWLVGALWLIALALWAVRFHRQNKSQKPVIAQYEPYADFLPMYTGVLFDYRLDPHDITGGIVYLAEQGFITIKKTERKVVFVFNVTDYEITLTRPAAEVPTDFLKQVLTLLFAADEAVGSMVPISSLVKNQVSNSKVVLALQQSLKADLQREGFLESKYGESARRVARAFLVIFVPIFAAFGVLGAFDASVVPLVAILVIGMLIIYLFACYNRRSVKGYEALNHLQGFKLFLSVTEKERYAFHNAPEKSPELFMEFLPYAIALKVEKEWAKVFEGITIPTPSWYQGDGVGAFSAAALTSDLGSFSTSFSSSSGTSGSSGGGSSGGGGGGGGGGSW